MFTPPTMTKMNISVMVVPEAVQAAQADSFWTSAAWARKKYGDAPRMCHAPPMEVKLPPLPPTSFFEWTEKWPCGPRKRGVDDEKIDLVCRPKAHRRLA